ncbi:MAG: hypothetical protein ACTTJ2_01345 [Anaerovoracaceae bacterium]
MDKNILILMIMNFIWIALGAGLTGFAFAKRKKLTSRMTMSLAAVGLVVICAGFIILMGLKSSM